jgi:hypothetical protein
MAELSEKCGKMCQYIGIAESKNGWHGPFIKREDPIAVLSGNEDPFMWKNKRGWHMLMHGKFICGLEQAQIDTCGSYAYSRDTHQWFMSPFEAYDGRVYFDGKKTEILEYRQRPKITFDNYGTPMILYNGGKRFSKPYVQNFAFRFNTEAGRNYQVPPPCPKRGLSAEMCGFNTHKGKRVKRDAKGCASLGPNKCLWCPKQKICVTGGSSKICDSPDPFKFYAHC